MVQPAGTQMGKSGTIKCDFVIVGAGSSGCVLASRLVRRGLKVLLIEAGPGDATKYLQSPSKWLHAACSGKALSEAFTTEPQPGLSNRRISAYRGRGGGGSSNINATLYSRGSRQDYEHHWPWELKDIEESFKSVERELVVETRRSPGTVGSSFERVLEQAGFPRAATATRAAAEMPPPSLGEGLGEDEPTWTEHGLTSTWTCTSSRGGRDRITAWTSFVKPVLAMPNLTIKDNTIVTKVLIEEGRVVGIEVIERDRGWRLRDRMRQLRFAAATTEVVLCGGVFRTAKLLMLSGIGPKQHLEDKSVAVVVDSPHVGLHLHDHLILLAQFSSKTPIPKEEYSVGSIHGQAYFPCEISSDVAGGANTSSAAGDTASPGDGVSSQATDGIVEDKPVIGYMFWDGRFGTDNMPLFLNMLLNKPSIVVTLLRFLAVALAWILISIKYIHSILADARNFAIMLMTIKSRGTVRLRSNDPRAPPVIDPAYFSDPEDERLACEAWRRLRRAIRETPEGQATLGRELLPGSLFNYGNDDKSFLKFAREIGTSFFHPVGTCRMGHAVEDSVVSSETLRVHGISGIRIADASIVQRIPSVPTQAMAMMIGDRAASIILADISAKDRMQEALMEAACKSIN